MREPLVKASRRPGCPQPRSLKRHAGEDRRAAPLDREVALALLAALTKKKTEEKPSDLAARLAELSPERDPIVIELRQQEPEVVARVAAQARRVEEIKQDLTDAEAHVRTRRQLLAEKATPERERDLEVAKETAAKIRAEKDDAAEMSTALIDRRVGLLDEISKAKAEAGSRAVAAYLDMARDRTEKRDAMFQQLETLTAECIAIRDALEAACPEVPIVNTYGHIAAFRRPDFRSGWDVVLGLDPHNPLTWAQRLFTHDPQASFGGLIRAWREVARDNELLPPDETHRARKAREKRERADALVESALKEDAAKAHLARVWGDVDNRDYSMKD